MMNRNDTLSQLSKGIRKFEGFTSNQVLELNWSGLRGLHKKDLIFFSANGGKPASEVANLCMARSLSNQGE